MANLTVKDRTYYVRFYIPKDRWEDAGRVLKSSTGERRDIIKSLKTRDYRAALRLRDAAIEAVRRDLNQKLIAADLKPLHGDSVPDWMVKDRLLDDALAARQEIQRASEQSDDFDEESHTLESPKTAPFPSCRTSSKTVPNAWATRKARPTIGSSCHCGRQGYPIGPRLIAGSRI